MQTWQLIQYNMAISRRGEIAYFIQNDTSKISITLFKNCVREYYKFIPSLWFFCISLSHRHTHTDTFFLVLFTRQTRSIDAKDSTPKIMNNSDSIVVANILFLSLAQTSGKVERTQSSNLICLPPTGERVEGIYKECEI